MSLVCEALLDALVVVIDSFEDQFVVIARDGDGNVVHCFSLEPAEPHASAVDPCDREQQSAGNQETPRCGLETDNDVGDP